MAGGGDSLCVEHWNSVQGGDAGALPPKCPPIHMCALYFGVADNGIGSLDNPWLKFNERIIICIFPDDGSFIVQL